MNLAKESLRLLHPFVSQALHRVRRRQTRLMMDVARRTLFAPRPDDIFLVSYPKSGTTLLQMILYQLTTEGEVDFPHIEARIPWYDLAVLSGRAAMLEQAPSPRVFKSHARSGQLPEVGRYIYIARDVRDVALSSFHHYSLVSGVDQELEPFLLQFFRGRFMFGSWFEHIASWWPRRQDTDVLFLTFEGLVGDLEGGIREIAHFCGLPIDEDRLPRILECCSLPFMRRHNQLFDPRRRRVTSTPAPSWMEDDVESVIWSDAQSETFGTHFRDLVSALGADVDDPKLAELASWGRRRPAEASQRLEVAP